MSIHLNKQDQRVLVAALEEYGSALRSDPSNYERRGLTELRTRDLRDAELAERLARLIGSIDNLPEEVTK